MKDSDFIHWPNKSASDLFDMSLKFTKSFKSLSVQSREDFAIETAMLVMNQYPAEKLWLCKTGVERRAYVRKTTINKCIDGLRKQNKEAARQVPLEDFYYPTTNPEHELILVLDLEALVNRDIISQEDLNALKMKIDGYTLSEISTHSGIPSSSLHRKLQRTQKKLKVLAEERLQC